MVSGVGAPARVFSTGTYRPGSLVKAGNLNPGSAGASPASRSDAASEPMGVLSTLRGWLSGLFAKLSALIAPSGASPASPAAPRPATPGTPAPPATPASPYRPSPFHPVPGQVVAPASPPVPRVPEFGPDAYRRDLELYKINANNPVHLSFATEEAAQQVAGLLGGTAEEGQVGSSRWIVIPAWNVNVGSARINAGAAIEILETKGLGHLKGVLATLQGTSNGGLTPEELAFARENKLWPTRENIQAFVAEKEATKNCMQPGSSDAMRISALRANVGWAGYMTPGGGVFDTSLAQALVAFKARVGVRQSYRTADGSWAINDVADPNFKAALLKFHTEFPGPGWVDF